MPGTMRVAHLTSVHARYDSRIFWKQCRSLAAAGHDVTLVVADGLPDELRDGVKIAGVARSSGRLGRMWHSARNVLETALALDCDLYHIHDPELLTIARKLKRKGKRVVFDAHEDLTVQILQKPYLPRVLRGLVSKVYHSYEQSTVGEMDGVITATSGLMPNYVAVARNREVVENFAIFANYPARQLDFTRLRILHAGALTAARGLNNMLRLASALRESDRLVLAGRLEPTTPLSTLSPAEYLGVVPHDQLAEEYGKANVGVILYNPCGQYHMATAIKLYEYMAASMPVLVPDHGEWPEFVRSRACGVAVNVEDVEAQLEALEWMRANPEDAARMGRNGRLYAEENASWESAFRRLEGFYQKVASAQQSPYRCREPW